MTDLLLAVAHHLLAFGLAAILAAEFAVTFPGLTGPGLRRLKNLDRYYGATAGLLVVIGILRVFYGGKGPEFYMQSPFFWAKMAAFIAAGLLSVPPTLQVIAWGKRAAADPGFALPPDEVASVRTYLSAELFLFALIPTFAAMMARGVGL